MPNRAHVIPLRPATAAPVPAPAAKEPLWRHVVGDVLRRERLAQERTLKEVAEAARISVPYLSELERGRKEASSEVLAAAARALGLGLADLLVLAQGELTRLAQARPAGTRVTPTPVTSKRGPSSGRTAAADEDDGTATSVGELSTRRGGARVASRRGEVRLAA